MEEFIFRCGRWIDLPAFLHPTKKPIRVLIKLHKNSLTNGYLIFILDSKVHSLIPLSQNISAAVNSSDVVIIIQAPTVRVLKITFDSPFLANLVNTQINICSFLSTSGFYSIDSFNDDFYQKYSLPLSSVEISNPSYPLIPPHYFPDSLKTFSARNLILNSGYFLEKQKASVIFFTWNVEQKVPAPRTSKEISFIFAPGAEVVYCALQEIDFSAKAILLGDSTLKEEWTKTLRESASWYGYDLIYFDQLGGVYTTAFKRMASPYNITVENMFSMRLGVNGLAANKSCCVSRLKIGETKICVIGAHLEAQIENVEIRNNQIKTVLSKVDHDDDDYTIIFGDLNYRIELPYHKTLDLIKDKKYDELFKAEQLKNMMKTDEVIGQFKEGDITFNPTFKFDDNCNNYDTSPKMRTPSWTDRILVRSSKPKLWTGLKNDIFFETSCIPVVCCNYNMKVSGSYKHNEAPDYPSPPVCSMYRSFDVQFSDHRPVLAEYSFDIVVADEKRLKLFKIQEDKHLDAINQLNTLKIHFDPDNLVLKVGQTSKFSMKNVNLSIGKWEIGVVPSYIHITPESGTLYNKPVELTIVVDKEIKEPEICSINTEGGSPAFFTVSTK